MTALLTTTEVVITEISKDEIAPGMAGMSEMGGGMF